MPGIDNIATTSLHTTPRLSSSLANSIPTSSGLTSTLYVPATTFPLIGKVFDEIDTFKNGPGGDLTGNQVRDKLTDIALKVLEDNKRLGSGPKSQAFGEFRSRLSPDPKGNGGNEGTEGFKHNSKLADVEASSIADRVSQDRTTERCPCHCEF